MNESVSIICVFANKNQLSDCLLKSLSFQNNKYELILIDGSKGDFSSCASALNYGATKSKGIILLFGSSWIFMGK